MKIIVGCLAVVGLLVLIPILLFVVGLMLNAALR